MEPSPLDVDPRASPQERRACVVEAHKHLVAACELFERARETALQQSSEEVAERTRALLERTTTSATWEIKGAVNRHKNVSGAGGSARVAPAPPHDCPPQPLLSPPPASDGNAARPSAEMPEELAKASPQPPARRRSSLLLLLPLPDAARGDASSNRRRSSASAFSDDATERKFAGSIEALQPLILATHAHSFELRVQAVARWEREQAGAAAALELNDDCRALIATLIPIMHKQQQSLKFMEAVAVVQETLTVVLDQVMDVFLIVVLWDAEEQRQDALTMACMLLTAHASMGLLSFFAGQGPTMTMLSLLGLKPILEGGRQLTGAETQPGQLFDNDFIFGATRVCDAAFETIPQSFFQSMVFFSSRVRRIGQWISLAFGLSNIAVSVGGANQFADTLETHRKIEPLYYGYYPGGAFAAFRLHVAEMGFAYFYAASKLAAVGMLGAASRLAVVAWLAAECMLLLVVRKCACGSWRFYKNNAMHGAAPSFVTHVCFYA